VCKVQWSHHGEDEATWEREEELHIDFPHLFPSPSLISRTRFLLRGRICNTQFVRDNIKGEKNHFPLFICV
jgi:hypothetical protein